VKHAEIVKELEALGLEEDEASVYLRLLQVGPSKVSQLSDHVDLSRSSLYRILDGLVEQGIVSKSLDRPTVYSPEDPQTIFELGSQDLQRQLAQLERVRDRVLDPLQEIAGDQSVRDGDYHWKRVEGASQIYELIGRRVQEAERSVDLLTNHGLCKRVDLPAVEKAWQVAAERGRNGVDLRLLVGFEDTVASVPDDVLGATDTIRSFDPDATIHFLLFDDRELMLLLRPQSEVTEPEEEVAVWTNAPGIVATHRSLVETVWTQAEPV
jgi:sugar-specific transcriptional regulator TrmB